jgi:hypothetical protein
MISLRLQRTEIARYAPASSVTIQHDFDKAVAIISNLEKQILNHKVHKEAQVH